jgi:pyridoxine 4-dehydrogenase
MNDVHELYLSYSLVHSSADVTMTSMSNTHSTTLGGTFTFVGTSLRVNRLGYGAMQLAGPGVFGPPRDVEGAFTLLREAVASGVNHIDTSDFYGPHVTNEIIRKALHPYPADLVIVTKVGFLRRDDKSWYPAASAAELTSAVHDNLKNLGLEALDIVNLRCGSAHGPNDESIAERLAVLIDLKRQGLVRHIGLSTISLAQYDEARRMTEIVCVQNEYNVARRADDALIAELAKAGVAYVPYFPLGGFTPLQSSALAEVAALAEATPMQVALAWLLQRSPNILLIPGTSSIGHLRENLAAAKLQLSPKMIETLDCIGAPATLLGGSA